MTAAGTGLNNGPDFYGLRGQQLQETFMVVPNTRLTI